MICALLCGEKNWLCGISYTDIQCFRQGQGANEDDKAGQVELLAVQMKLVQHSLQRNVLRLKCGKSDFHKLGQHNHTPNT